MARFLHHISKDFSITRIFATVHLNSCSRSAVHFRDFSITRIFATVHLNLRSVPQFTSQMQAFQKIRSDFVFGQSGQIPLERRLAYGEGKMKIRTRLVLIAIVFLAAQLSLYGISATGAHAATKIVGPCKDGLYHLGNCTTGQAVTSQTAQSTLFNFTETHESEVGTAVQLFYNKSANSGDIWLITATETDDSVVYPVYTDIGNIDGELVFTSDDYPAIFLGSLDNTLGNHPYYETYVINPAYLINGSSTNTTLIDFSTLLADDPTLDGITEIKYYYDAGNPPDPSSTPLADYTIGPAADQLSSVPEPSTLKLWITGLGCALFAWKLTAKRKRDL